MANHISFHPIYIIRSGYTDAASRLHSDEHQGTLRCTPTAARPFRQRRVWAGMDGFGPFPWLAFSPGRYIQIVVLEQLS